MTSSTRSSCRCSPWPRSRSRRGSHRPPNRIGRATENHQRRTGRERRHERIGGDQRAGLRDQVQADRQRDDRRPQRRHGGRRSGHELRADGLQSRPAHLSAERKTHDPRVWHVAERLVAGIKDEISGMELQIKCNGTTIATFTGDGNATVSANSTLEFGAGFGRTRRRTETPVDHRRRQNEGPSGDTKIGAEEVEHEPHWYSDGTRIVEGTVSLATTGSVSIKALGSVIKCKLHRQRDDRQPGRRRRRHRQSHELRSSPAQGRPARLSAERKTLDPRRRHVAERTDRGDPDQG